MAPRLNLGKPRISRAGRAANKWGVAAVRKRLRRKAKQDSALPFKPLRKKLPVRSAKNPVRVVFVCRFGGSSSAECKRFQELLARLNIASVKASFVSLAIKSSGVSKPSERIQKVLRRADLVASVLRPGASENNLLEQVPKESFMQHSPFLYSDFTEIFSNIQNRFRLPERLPSKVSS